jgi:putative copper export protein
MDRFRRRLLASGLVGLLACASLAAVAAWLVTGTGFKAPLPYPAVTWLFALVFGGISLVEMPMMIFAMRRLLVERKSNYGLVLGLNALFVFFAAVYGTPVLLFTASLAWGLTLCALGIARFVSSLLFVREPSPKPPAGVGREATAQPGTKDQG